MKTNGNRDESAKETDVNSDSISEYKSGRRRHFPVHKFSPELKEKVRDLCKLDNYHGILYMLEDWAIISTAVAISLVINAFSPGTWLNFLVYALAVLVIGSRMRALVAMMHLSTHGSLAKHRTLNFVLGTAFGGWPILQSWTAYHRNHVIEHHAFIGDPDRDPDFHHMRTTTGLYDPKTTKLDVIKYLLSIPGPRYTLTTWYYLVTAYIVPATEARYETVLRATYWMTILGTFYHVGQLPVFFYYWLVPLTTTCTWVAALTEFVEHYPLLRPEIQTRGELYMSRNRLCNWLENFFTGWHGEAYHMTHHLFPRLPGWNIRKAHLILMQDPDYKAAHYHRPGWIGVFEEILGHFD